jgi:hypothetical protein
MKEYKLREYSYNCGCGYRLKVVIDCGIPQDHFKCRRCGASVARSEL